MDPHSRRRLKVAVVAPSLRILGGQAIQADHLLARWSADPDVDAWLVPIDPGLPGVARHLQRIKYVRTVLTQLAYWPLLVGAEYGRAGLRADFAGAVSHFS